MHKYFYLVVILLLVAGSASAQYRPDLAVQTDRNTGYMDITGATSASFTISLPADAITDIGAYVPVGCKGFAVHAWGSDIILNDDGQLATGSIYVGDKIASGSSMKWEGKKAGAVNLHGAPNGTSAATVTLTLW